MAEKFIFNVVTLCKRFRHVVVDHTDSELK